MAVVLLEHEAFGEHLRPVQHAAGLGIQHQHHDDHALVAEDAALAQHGRAHVAHALAVHQRAFHRHGRLQTDAVRQQGQGTAVLQQDHVVGLDAALARQLPVLEQMAVLPVYGHEIFRPHRAQQFAQFVTVGVARGVDGPHALVQDRGPQAIHLVDEARHGLDVAGDHARAHDHGVALADAELAVAAQHHARQRGQRFALGAGHHQHQLLVGQVGHAVMGVEKAGRQLGDAQIAGHLDIVGQRLAADDHGAPALARQVEDFLDALDVAGEQRHHDAARSLVEDLAQGLHDGPFGEGTAVALHIGGIGEQQARALRPGEVAKCRQIRAAAGQGLGIDLEVPAVDDAAHGRLHAQAETFGDGMAHGEEMEGHVAQGHLVTGLHRAQLHPVQQLVLPEFVLHQGQGEIGAVDARAAQLGHQPRQGADVVFVAVGQDDAQQFVAHGAHRAEMRDDHVHAQMEIIREHQAAVHHDHACGSLPQLAVETDLPQTTQGSHCQKLFRITHTGPSIFFWRRHLPAAGRDDIRPWLHRSGKGPSGSRPWHRSKRTGPK